MIEHWEEKAFQNIILNRIWEIFPVFVVWESWKERNNHVFDGRKRSLEEAWPMIDSYIRETLGLKRWGSSNLLVGPKEMMILRNWEICSIPKYVGNIREGARDGNSPAI